MNGDLAALRATGTGYVFNHYTTGPTAAQYNLLFSPQLPGIRARRTRETP